MIQEQKYFRPSLYSSFVSYNSNFKLILADYLESRIDILDLTIYHGWKIYTHVGKVTHQEAPNLKRKIESWFDQKINSPIQVNFKGKTTEQEESMGLNKYGVIIESNFFGLRGEYAHQQLCYEVLQKITWQKQAYLLKNNEWIPVPKRRILRKKKL